jgi:hypothetical protein
VRNDALDVPPDLLSWDAERFDALFLNPGVSSSVTSRIVAEIMGHSVHLDRKTGGFTKEVEHKWAKRVLLAKLQPVGAQPKYPPESDF